MVYGPAQCYTCSRVVLGERVYVSIFSISALFFCFLLNVLFFSPVVLSANSSVPFFWVQGADTNGPQLA